MFGLIALHFRGLLEIAFWCTTSENKTFEIPGQAFRRQSRTHEARLHSICKVYANFDKDVASFHSPVRVISTSSTVATTYVTCSTAPAPDCQYLTLAKNMCLFFSSLRFACELRRETASAMLGASWPPNSWPAGFDRHRVGPTFVRESEVGSIIARNPTTGKIITKPLPSESEDFIFGGWGGGGWGGTN